MKTWATNEIPNRAPPLPLEALEMMIGQSLFQKDDLFALSLMLAFHGLLRTGELLGVQKAHCQQSGPPKGARGKEQQKASPLERKTPFGDFGSGKIPRTPGARCVKLRTPGAKSLLLAWKPVASATTSFVPTV